MQVTYQIGVSSAAPQSSGNPQFQVQVTGVANPATAAEATAQMGLISAVVSAAAAVVESITPLVP